MKILPLFISHQGCPFQCIYCNQKAITKSSSFNFEQAARLIRNFCKRNQDKDKEIAFFGGTFTSLSPILQQKYFELVTPYQKEISGIRISTRPDFIDDKILTNLHKNNVTVIELGVQSFSDEVLDATKRGYNSVKAQNNCRLIKNSGFKLGIQLMPGLPAFQTKTWQQTLQITKQLQPDYVRLYPTVVISNTILAKLYQQGKYNPLELEKAVDICAEAALLFSQNNIEIIKMGLHSDIDEVIAGPYHPTFGELVNGRILCQKILKVYQPANTIIINPRFLSLLTGFSQKNINFLKEKLGLEKLPLIISTKTDYFSLGKQKAQRYL